jgi:hypothetical protein
LPLLPWEEGGGEGRVGVLRFPSPWPSPSGRGNNGVVFRAEEGMPSLLKLIDIGAALHALAPDRDLALAADVVGDLVPAFLDPLRCFLG